MLIIELKKKIIKEVVRLHFSDEVLNARKKKNSSLFFSKFFSFNFIYPPFKIDAILFLIYSVNMILKN